MKAKTDEIILESVIEGRAKHVYTASFIIYFLILAFILYFLLYPLLYPYFQSYRNAFSLCESIGGKCCDYSKENCSKYGWSPNDKLGCKGNFIACYLPIGDEDIPCGNDTLYSIVKNEMGSCPTNMSWYLDAYNRSYVFYNVVCSKNWFCKVDFYSCNILYCYKP